MSQIGHKIVKLSCGDIVIGVVNIDTSALGTSKYMKEPWEYINLGTMMQPQYTLAPYQTFLWGEGKEVNNLELKESQVVYIKDLNSVPDLKKVYFERVMDKSGIVV